MSQNKFFTKYAYFQLQKLCGTICFSPDQTTAHMRQDCGAPPETTQTFWEVIPAQDIKE